MNWVGNPEVWTLEAIPWQFFASLTFRGTRLANRSLKASTTRVSMWFALYRRFCRQFGIADRRLLWCLREEAGEVGGRMHLHALIGGVPAALVNERTCFWLMHTWDKTLRGGHARVRVYDSTLPGVEYVLKCGVTGANAYETTKFAGHCQVMLSKSICGLLSSASRKVGGRSLGSVATRDSVAERANTGDLCKP